MKAERGEGERLKDKQVGVVWRHAETMSGVFLYSSTSRLSVLAVRDLEGIHHEGAKTRRREGEGPPSRSAATA